MKFYHGTSVEALRKIQQEGVLWGKGMSYRFTYLTPEIEVASKYGEIILEVDYEPRGYPNDNYGFNPPKGETCWQFSVFIPIGINQIEVVKEETKDD